MWRKSNQCFWKNICAIFVSFFASYALTSAQNHVSERRVYYLDATYSMISPSKLWNPVRNDLAKAINAIEDENTEIYVVAFGGNGGNELKTWHGFATDSDKHMIISGFQNFVPQKNTMTYLNRPLNDFYMNKVAKGKVTYCFLMTDGKDENQYSSDFYNCLRQWGSRFGNENVYGFYVMLNDDAKDNEVERIIDSQEHLWKVESADVNINLIRLDNVAVFNVRSDDFIEIPISGNLDNLSFEASFPNSRELKATKCSLQDGKLRVDVSVNGNKSLMPDDFRRMLSLSLMKQGEFDFLVTDRISVRCVNKRERILRTSVNKYDFGKVRQYASFLFSPERINSVQGTISFDFNDDAKNDPYTYAEFSFVDKNGIPVDLCDMKIKINGKNLDNNVIRITPDAPVANMEILFSSRARSGKYRGWLRLIRSNLQRLNNDMCDEGATIDAFEWMVYNDKVMNPLAERLLIAVLLVVVSLLFWFFIVKPVKYPRFPKFRKMVLVERNGVVVAQFTVNFKGARKIVFSSQKVKQSGLNRLFTGKISTVVNPVFELPVAFVPRKRKMAAVVGSGYLSTPNPIPQSGTAVINESTRRIMIYLR